MKTLCFIGNKELWNAQWFKTLLEKLKETPNLAINTLDQKSDAKKIKDLLASLADTCKAVIQEGLSFEELFLLEDASVSRIVLSNLYQFSRDPTPVASIRQIPTTDNPEILLRETSYLDTSKVATDDFLNDFNVDISELEKSLEAPLDESFDARDLSVASEAPSIDAEALLADEIEISKLISVSQVAESGDSSHLSIQNFDEESKPPIILHATEKINLPAQEVIHDTVVDDLSLGALESVGNESVSLEDVKINLASEAPVEVKKLISAMSPEISHEDLEVLKRYSAIKERELKEAQSSQEALRRQVRYVDERLKKSEDERRRLLLKFEESENNLRTALDKKDEGRAALKNIESHYEEKIKSLQIQSESAQFQSSKLERKLEEFRERVRTDLQKIRSRERELASRLEIQKRDAEALLSAKDERLIQQKREIDRLEFELDALREKLLDEAQKSEERRKRIARALQSLKLAQSVLAGLEEEGISLKDEEEAA